MGLARLSWICVATGLLALSLPALAPSTVRADEAVAIEMTLEAMTSAVHGAMSRLGEDDFYQLYDDYPVAPSCGMAALRLTRSAITLSDVAWGAETSVATTLDVAASLVSSVGFHRVGDAVDIVGVALESDTPNDFVANLESWAAGEFAGGTAARLPSGFDLDGAMREATAELAETLHGAVQDAIAASEATDLVRLYDHPQCGEISLIYGVRQHSTWGSLSRFRARGDCQGRWPAIGSVQLRDFEFEMSADLDAAPANAQTVTLLPGEPADWYWSAGCRSDPVLDPQSYVGRWVGEGYRCLEPQPAQEIEIALDGDDIVATKVTGDACIGAGEITWIGTIGGGDHMNVSIQACDTPCTQYSWRDDRLEIVSTDELRMGSLVFRRTR